MERPRRKNKQNGGGGDKGEINQAAQRIEIGLEKRWERTLRKKKKVYLKKGRLRREVTKKEEGGCGQVIIEERVGRVFRGGKSFNKIRYDKKFAEGEGAPREKLFPG